MVLLLLLGVVSMHALTSGSASAHAPAAVGAATVHTGPGAMAVGHDGPAGCAAECPPALGHLGALCLAVLAAALVGWLVVVRATRLPGLLLAGLRRPNGAAVLRRPTSWPLAPPSLLVLCTSRT